MAKLTVDQLADILFQNENRITAGILKQRSAFTRMKDDILCRTRTNITDMTRLDYFKSKLLLEFDASIKVEEEHPRSLKKAMLELKNIGYSNEQIYEIRDKLVRRFLVRSADCNTPVTKILETRFPKGACFAFNDNAFLTTAMFTPPSSEYALEGFEFATSNPHTSPVANTPFNVEDYDEVFEHFKFFISEQCKKYQSLLIPEKPVNAVINIKPL